MAKKKIEKYVFCSDVKFEYKGSEVKGVNNGKVLYNEKTMEPLRKLIEDYMNGEQKYISFNKISSQKYDEIIVDCSGFSFDKDYYDRDMTKVEDETEQQCVVSTDGKKSTGGGAVIKEMLLLSSFGSEMSDEITETDKEYFAEFAKTDEIQTMDKKSWKAISVSELGDFYVPNTQQLKKRDFLKWDTFKDVKSNSKEKIEFDFAAVNKDLGIKVDYAKIAEAQNLFYEKEPSYNFLNRILKENSEINFLKDDANEEEKKEESKEEKKEEKKDLVADAANKILSAFYNGKFIHPLECDGSMYTEKIKNLIGASDEKFKQQKETMDLFAKMKSALTENNFAFYNPVCFLEKLDGAGLLKFNPYEGKTYIEILNEPLDPIMEVDVNTERVISNPGMTTLYNPRYDSKLKPVVYKGKKYSRVNGFFNAQYKNVHPDYTEYWHEGIDFRGKTGSTIVCLVYGKVLRCGKRPGINQGFIVIQSEKDKNLFYLALHVDHNTLEVKDGEPVYPGKELAKTVYLPDSKGVDQSHLHVSVIRLPDGVVPESPKGVIRVKENTFPTWGLDHTPNQDIWKNMVNPFNYNDPYTWKGRY